jgi:hypothetical protein
MKVKTILLFAATLIIGIVIGMLASAQLRLNKLKPMRVYFSEQRFRDGFYSAIQPDEAQKAKIDQILDKYARINSGFQSTFRRSLDSTMREFRKELDSNLTSEQLARLKELDEKRQEMMRDARRRNSHNDDHRRGDERGNRPYHNHDRSYVRRQGSSGDSTSVNR